MIIKNKIPKEELRIPFTKAVADIKRGILSLGDELHSDCVEELINDGSAASDLWGFNIYPDGRLDFISLINIKPVDGNRSMEIQNPEIRQKIEETVRRFL